MLPKSNLGISISLSRSISSSISFPLIKSLVFDSTFEDNDLGFRIETIVETVGLVVKTCRVPIGEIHTGILIESKTDVFSKLPKIEVSTSEVLTRVFTIEALIGVHKTEESKTTLTTKELRIVEHSVSIVETRSIIEGLCSLVDEVIDTSIYDVLR